MTTRRAARRRAAERGSAAVPIALALPVMIGFIGLALDLAYLYGRQTELQQLADNVALAAARQLNGTSDGALNAEVAADSIVASSKYNFSKQIRWNSAALSFAATHDALAGAWTAASAVDTDAKAKGLVFARVDTSTLLGPIKAGAIGTITTFFAHGLANRTTFNLSAQAVAGPTSVQVTPLAICALNTNPLGSRQNPSVVGDERITYGFRRGVSYNLLDLSPNSTTPVAYLVNPISSGAGTSNDEYFKSAYVKQFFCSGTMALPSVPPGSSVHVQLLGTTQVHNWLNSRFGDPPATTGCNATVAPPDANIMEFTGGYTDWYMDSTTNPFPATAAGVNKAGSPGKRMTFADLAKTDSSGTATADSFGPLWAFSKPESVDGNQYSLSQWDKLYIVGSVKAAVKSSKYGSGNGVYGASAHTLAPSSGTPGVWNRRVLNIPLLDCSAGNPATSATVLGIGRFFMTARAKLTPQPTIPGEFAGMVGDSSPTNSVGLYK
jgi:Flp pilus assembly protein TadG